VRAWVPNSRGFSQIGNSTPFTIYRVRATDHVTALEMRMRVTGVPLPYISETLEAKDNKVNVTVLTLCIPENNIHCQCPVAPTRSVSTRIRVVSARGGSNRFLHGSETIWRWYYRPDDVLLQHFKK
jgi:REP element-mobilizing transposase RayT